MLEDRAYGALLGLAAGDAIGGPALYHRTIPLGWQRRMLWQQARELDQQQVNKPPVPFTLSAAVTQPEALFLSGTDDAESAAIAALILTDVEDPCTEQLFASWCARIADHAEGVWTSIAERAAIQNVNRHRLAPPASGNDNPHYFDDTAVARAVPVGIRYHRDPELAAQVAMRLASITNADDGVWAAGAMAATIATTVSTDDLSAGLEAGRNHIPADSWLGRNFSVCDEIARTNESVFAAIPELSERVVNASYSFGNIAAETLPVAYTLASACQADLSQGISFAALVPKQADSMPAMVGALCGAASGAEGLPSSWHGRLDRLKGICYPQVAGLSLAALAQQLLVLPG